jgi:predicted AAA+ superfamily ATPase
VKRWVDLLEAVYYCYRIKPYSTKVKNSILKEPKLYLFDWSSLPDGGQRWENLIAGHLLKSCHAWTDCAMGEFQLHYVRDKQNREVDFLVTDGGKPFLLLEVKTGRSEPTSSLLYYHERLKPKFTIQLVREKRRERASSLRHPGVMVMDGARFLSALN